MITLFITLLLDNKQWGLITWIHDGVYKIKLPINATKQVMLTLSGIKSDYENPGEINFPQSYATPYDNTSITVTMDVHEDADVNKVIPGIYWMCLCQ